MMPILMLLAFAPIFFMMFRKQKKEQQQRASLKKGDRVVSNSGLIGELMELDERVAKVKIAPGTTVQMLTSTIAPMPTEVEKGASAPPASAEKEKSAT